MFSRTVVHSLYRGLIVTLIMVICFTQVSVALAGNYRVGAVGGVMIQIDGVVLDAAPAQRHKLAQLRRQDHPGPVGKMTQSVAMRMISLKSLEAACRNVLAEDNGELPDEIRYLGGLQRIQYVFVYPERDDVILAGPAEGWKIDNEGNVVGITTGRPVLKFDDLVVAMRTVTNARKGGISCSINPTAEGVQALNKLLASQGRTQSRDISRLEKSMKTAFGPQQISLAGVDPSSHLARVLVAADYRMKRLAMNLDPSPIAGFPSYVELVRNARQQSTKTNPRWWLACNYEPVAKSDDGLAWELRGQGVKCLTQDDIIAEDGTARQAGRTSPMAQKWADMMTEKFDELAGEEAIFGELRNVMDLCVVAAVIDQHELCAKAGCELPLLTGSTGDLAPEYWHPPKSVPAQCSFLQTRNGWVVTASGGVQIDSFQVASQAETVGAVKQAREKALKPSSKDAWWWN